METHDSSPETLKKYFQAIENIIYKKSELLKLNHYNGAENVRIRDKETLTELESIYGILQILNERVSKLEK